MHNLDEQNSCQELIHPHEFFEQYVNAELKLKILEETNTYIAHKNTATSFNVEDL